MIYEISLFPDALFHPAAPLQKLLDGFANEAGPYLFLIHPVFGTVAYSCPTKSVWPGIEPGKTVSDLYQFIAEIVVPGESHHLAQFWNKVESKEKNLMAQFVINGRQNRQGSMLGIVVYLEDWGSLWVLIPGENADHLDSMTKGFTSWKTASFWEDVQSWVCESEIESMVGNLLSAMPKTLRPMTTFWRSVRSKNYWGKIYSQNLAYRFRGDRWQRELTEERPEIRKVIEKQARRHAGVVIDGEISVCFSVYVGGIRSLGILETPVAGIKDEGLNSVNHFLHVMSRSLCKKAVDTTIRDYSYVHLALQDGHFGIDSLGVVAQVISSTHWKSFPVLPLWFDQSQNLLKSVQKIDESRYITDILFINTEGTYGCLLLADTSLEKAYKAKDKLHKATGFVIEDPVRLGNYIKNQ